MITHSFSVSSMFFFHFFSKLDIHAMHYCFSINTRRHHNRLCEAAMQSLLPDQLEGGQFDYCSRFYSIDNLLKIKSEKIRKIGKRKVRIEITS